MFPTEDEKHIRKWIQVESLLNHAGQIVYHFSQIGVATGNMHLVSTGKTIKHMATLAEATLKLGSISAKKSTET